MGRVFFGGGCPKMRDPGSSLPSGYTELAYIEGTGSQYIDTGVSMANGNVGIEIDFQFTQYVDNTFIFRQYCNGDLLGIGLYSNNFYTTNVTMSQTSDMLARTTASGTATGTANMNVSLFAQSVSNGTTTSITNCCCARIYSCRIYNNGTLIRDLVPCVSDADGIGLFDLVNKQFYGNTGSGSFVGSEVA